MPKRVKMIWPNGKDEIEIYDNQVDHYLLLGFSLLEKEKKDTRPIVENQLEEEETTFIEE